MRVYKKEPHHNNWVDVAADKSIIAGSPLVVTIAGARNNFIKVGRGHKIVADRRAVSKFIVDRMVWHNCMSMV